MARIATLLTLACLSLVPAQSDSLAQSALSFPNTNIALHSVRQVYQLLVGFEISSDVTLENTPIELDLSGMDEASAFDAIVKQRTGYVWNMENGIYNFYPKRQNDSLSQLIIGNFVVTDATFRDIQSALFNQPEVREWLRLHHAIRSGLINSTAAMPPKGAPVPEPKKISLNLRNMQLRLILNQVISKLGTDQWIIGHVAAKGQFAEYVSIEF